MSCLSLLALTSCAENPEAGRPSPQASDTTSPATSSSAAPITAPSASSTASPSAPEVPERPSTATGLSLAAGELFIGHYIDLINHSYTTGDPGPLLAASDKGCIGCREIGDFVKISNARNGGLTGYYKDRLTTVKELFRGTNGRLGGSAAIRTGAFRERPTRSASPVPRPASKATLEFTLLPAGGNWVMYEMEINQ